MSDLVIPAPLPFLRLPSGCDLLDFGCHAQTMVWEWWSLVSWPTKVLIVVGVIAVILGVLRGFLSLLHRVGGWPAVIGFVLLVAGLVVAALPRRPDRAAAQPAAGKGGGRRPYRVPPPRRSASPRPPFESLSQSNSE